MKKLICGASLFVLFTACNQTNPSTQNKTGGTISTGKNSIQYVCPMDADVITNKPGICPKCGMKLVKK